MTASLNPLQVLSNTHIHTIATCYKIIRKDGTFLYLSDHNHEITFEGNVYTPAGGVMSSAKQKRNSLDTDNLELQGFLTSDAITTEDLRAGKYRDAQVVITVIDYTKPYRPYLTREIYHIAETVQHDNFWLAKHEGITRQLNQDVGRIYSATCRYQLGDTSCGVNLASFTHAATITSVTDARAAFILNVPTLTGVTDNTSYFKYGRAEFLTGNNAGETFEIATQSATAGTATTITLAYDTPFDIEDTDTLNVIAGCTRQGEYCVSRFSNLPKFGGFPTIPGTSKAQETPPAR